MQVRQVTSGTTSGDPKFDIASPEPLQAPVETPPLAAGSTAAGIKPDAAWQDLEQLLTEITSSVTPTGSQPEQGLDQAPSRLEASLIALGGRPAEQSVTPVEANSDEEIRPNQALVSAAGPPAARGAEPESARNEQVPALSQSAPATPSEAPEADGSWDGAQERLNALVAVAQWYGVELDAASFRI